MMAEIDLIKIEPQELLSLLKTAYYDQTGETIQIGSNEYASSAAQTYAWSVLLNSINDATRNRFIDTARSTFLDAIAANYGINQRPEGYHATCSVKLTFSISEGITIYAESIKIQDAGGRVFTNKSSILSDNDADKRYIFTAVEAGSKNNGIPAGEVTQIIEGGSIISAATNTNMTDGGTDGYPYTDEGDELYREWLKTEIQSFAGAGTAQAFEARAKNADSRVKEAYVIRQTDSEYVKGKVIIYIYTDYAWGDEIRDIVKAACDDPSFRPVGDFIEVNHSGLDYESFGGFAFQVTIPSQYSSDALAKLGQRVEEFNAILGAKINKPFLFTEFCDYIKNSNEDGMSVLDCKPINMTQYTASSPIYPAPGYRLYINEVFWSITYI